MSRLGVVVLAAALSWSAPAWAAELIPEGSILVADRSLKDPNFVHTAVVILYNSEEGATGLVLNRRTQTPMSQALDSIEGAEDLADLKKWSDPVFWGGPVESRAVLTLVRSDKPPAEGARPVVEGVYTVSIKRVMDGTIKARGPDQLRVFVGYSGWTAGQLEDEISVGAWRLLRGNAEWIFDSDPATLWERMVRRLEMRIARMFGPPQASP